MHLGKVVDRSCKFSFKHVIILIKILEARLQRFIEVWRNKVEGLTEHGFALSSFWTFLSTVILTLASLIYRQLRQFEFDWKRSMTP